MAVDGTLKPEDHNELLDPANISGKTFGSRQYKVKGYLGGGGYSWVYEAWDPHFRSRVAIKIMKRLGNFSNEDFRREARLQKEFRHPHVVEVYDYGIDGGTAWLVMDLLPGSPLDQVLDVLKRQGRRLPDDKIRKFVTEISSALENAHDQNLVHRDLKPQNIMYVREGRPGEHFKVLDFGISSKIDAEGTQRNATSDGAGTPEYMSPEQVQAQRGDSSIAAKSDIYSFGVILHQLLTGRVPYPLSGTSPLAAADCLRNIVETPPQRLTEVTDHPISPDVEKLILQCLEKNPGDRPQSMTEVRERFLAAFHPPRVPLAQPVPRWSRVVLFFITALVVCAALILWRRPRPTAPPQPSLSLFVDEPEPLHAGDKDESFQITLVRTSFKGPVRIRIEGQEDLPRGVWISPSEPVELSTEQERVKQKYKVTADLNADIPHTRTTQLRIVAFAPDSNKTEETKQAAVAIIVEPPDVWLPPGFQRLETASILRVSGVNYHERIYRDVQGEQVVFLLIKENPEFGNGLRSFYIMENKVSVDLFEKSDVAKALTHRKWRTDKYGNPIQDGRLPVTNVTFLEAHRFAGWLAEPHVEESKRRLGRLPSEVEWDTAAGLYDWKAGKLNGTQWKLGPYMSNESYDPKNNEQVAVDRKGPLPVGSASHDRSCYGCRDMAGNGTELTRSGLYDGAEAVAPFPEPDNDDFIFLRGQTCDADKPTDYKQLTDPDEREFLEYQGKSSDTGFRVVLEPQ